jgi:ribosomal protein L32E
VEQPAPKSSTETGRLKEAAVHEAAHAVVAWHRGLTVHVVSIIREEGSDGVVVHRDPWYGISGSSADHMHAAIIAAEVGYAGDLAVQTYLGCHGSGWEEDLVLIADDLNRVNSSREQMRRMASWIEQRVRDLLVRPEIRASVLSVANALETDGSLDHARFLEVVEGTRRGLA